MSAGIRLKQARTPGLQVQNSRDSSDDVHALGRTDIAEEVPTKLDPQTGGNRSKGNGPPIFRLVGTQQNS